MSGNDGKGRRAAERRRARDGQKAPVQADGLTTPGAVIDPEDIDEDSLPSQEDQPLISDVRAVEPDQPAGTQPARKNRGLSPQVDNDPEASFVRAVREVREDEGPAAEQTAMRDRPKKKAKLGGKFVILEDGAIKGDLPIALTPSLIGRTATAELLLSDMSVSLRHAELRHGVDGFVLYDVGSSSGTLVNGVPIEGEVLLEHGDLLQMGKVELRFLRAAEVPKDRPLPAPREPTVIDPTLVKDPTKLQTKLQTKLKTQFPQKTALEIAALRQKRVRKTAVLVISGCVAVLLAAVTIRLLQQHVFTDKSAAQVRAQVAQLLADGTKKLLAQDVDGALATGETILALDPTNVDANSLIKMARTERDARDALALALRLGDEERDVEAEQILKRIPDASAFAKDRDRLRRTLAERGLVRARRGIESLLDRGDAKGALAACEAHLTQYPNDSEAKELCDRASAAVASQPKNPALSRARQLFGQGDVDGARAAALEGGYRGYVADLDRFVASLQKGRDALKQSMDGTAALPALDEAFRLLGPLGGGPQSAILGETKKPYANALYLTGTEKLEKGDRCGGARDLFRAGRVLPEDPKIQNKLRALDDMAEQGLVKAAAARAQDPERAAALARESLCVARTGTRTHEDLKQLARL